MIAAIVGTWAIVFVAVAVLRFAYLVFGEGDTIPEAFVGSLQAAGIIAGALFVVYGALFAIGAVWGAL